MFCEISLSTRRFHGRSWAFHEASGSKGIQGFRFQGVSRALVVASRAFYKSKRVQGGLRNVSYALRGFQRIYGVTGVLRRGSRVFNGAPGGLRDG